MSVYNWRLYFSVVPSELATTDTPTEGVHVAESSIDDTAGDEGKEEKEKAEEDESTPDAVSVHVEATLGAVELLLYSDMGEVAVVSVKGRVIGCIDLLQEDFCVYHRSYCIGEYAWIWHYCTGWVSLYNWEILHGQFIGSFTTHYSVCGVEVLDCSPDVLYRKVCVFCLCVCVVRVFLLCADCVGRRRQFCCGSAGLTYMS